MLPETRKKMVIALILFFAAGIMIRLAFATIAEDVSVWLMGAGVLLMLASMFVFGRYFKE